MPPKLSVRVKKKKERYGAYSHRALADLALSLRRSAGARNIPQKNLTKPEIPCYSRES